MEIKTPCIIEYIGVKDEFIVEDMKRRLKHCSEWTIKRLVSRNNEDIIDEAFQWCPELKHAIKQAKKISLRLTKAQLKKHETSKALCDYGHLSISLYIKLKWNQALLEKLATIKMKRVVNEN
jgi:hypothetical protein